MGGRAPASWRHSCQPSRPRAIFFYINRFLGSPLCVFITDMLGSLSKQLLPVKKKLIKTVHRLTCA